MYYQIAQILIHPSRYKYEITIITEDTPNTKHIGPVSLLVNDSVARTLELKHPYDLRNAIRVIKRVFGVIEVPIKHEIETKRYKIIEYKQAVPVV